MISSQLLASRWIQTSTSLPPGQISLQTWTCISNCLLYFYIIKAPLLNMSKAKIWTLPPPISSCSSSPAQPLASSAFPGQIPKKSPSKCPSLSSSASVTKAYWSHLLKIFRICPLLHLHCHTLSPTPLSRSPTSLTFVYHFQTFPITLYFSLWAIFTYKLLYLCDCVIYVFSSPTRM